MNNQAQEAIDRVNLKDWPEEMKQSGRVVIKSVYQTIGFLEVTGKSRLSESIPGWAGCMAYIGMGLGEAGLAVPKIDSALVSAFYYGFGTALKMMEERSKQVEKTGVPADEK